MSNRRSMGSARKKRIWLREGGVCWICRLPVEESGPGVRYDHLGVLWITNDDSDEAIFPIHTACDKVKTYGSDLPTVAKIKRLIKANDPDRVKKESRLKGRGFEKPKVKPKWPKRPFRR